MNPIVWIVVAALAVLIAVAAVVSARTRRTTPETTATRGPDAASAPPPPPVDEEVLWGLYQPGTDGRVQRMAKSMAAGFASIDPDETAEVVRSADGGATWHTIPRDEWFG